MRTAVFAFLLFGILVDFTSAQVANTTMADSDSKQLTLRWLEATTRSYLPPPSYDQTYIPPRQRQPDCSPENGVWGCPK